MSSLVNNCFSVAPVAEEIGVLLSENLCAILLMIRETTLLTDIKEENQETNKQPQDMKEH